MNLTMSLLLNEVIQVKHIGTSQSVNHNATPLTAPEQTYVLKPLWLYKLWWHFIIKAVRKICSEGSLVHLHGSKRMKGYNKAPFKKF